MTIVLSRLPSAIALQLSAIESSAFRGFNKKQARLTQSSQESRRSLWMSYTVSGDTRMETRITEIATRIYHLSTYIPPADLRFNQVLIDAEEPFLFHAGMKSLFPLVSAAVARIIPLTKLRWISYGHHEADESGAVN